MSIIEGFLPKSEIVGLAGINIYSLADQLDFNYASDNSSISGNNFHKSSVYLKIL